MKDLLPLTAASVFLLGPAWIDWWIEGGDLLGRPYPLWLVLVLVVNLALTISSPRWKRLLVRSLQRWVVNPPVRLSLRCRVPLGWCLLETTGRRSGRTRTVPVGNGLEGDVLWVIAEHGTRAGYVHNIRACPEVRVLLRRHGARMSWVSGHASVLDDDDPYARQRLIAGWRHPVRLLNAMIVRVLGAEPVTVRIDLAPRAVPTQRPAARHEVAA